MASNANQDGRLSQEPGIFRFADHWATVGFIAFIALGVLGFQISRNQSIYYPPERTLEQAKAAYPPLFPKLGMKVLLPNSLGRASTLASQKGQIILYRGSCTSCSTGRLDFLKVEKLVRANSGQVLVVYSPNGQLSESLEILKQCPSFEDTGKKFSSQFGILPSTHAFLIRNGVLESAIDLRKDAEIQISGGQ